MSVESVHASGRDEQLGAVIFACAEALEGGAGPEELLARYPEYAAELEQFFAGRAGVEEVAGPLRQAVRKSPTVAGAADRTVPEGNEPPADWRDGSFGDYELLGEIGQGGMGVVYKARQKSLNRPVALKMLRIDRWG